MAIKDKSIPPYAAHLLDFIGDIEAPRGYDTVYGNNQGKLKKRVTQMTIAEVQAAQPGWHKQFGSSATGRYQFMRDTLKDLIAEQRLDTSAKFDAAMQDRLAFALLRRRGYDKFVAGKLGVTAFAKLLAQEWASLPVLQATQGQKRRVMRGESYYEGDKLNKSLVTPERFEAAIKTNLPGTVGEHKSPIDLQTVPTVPTVPVPTAPLQRPTIWQLIWSLLRGKDATVATVTPPPAMTDANAAKARLLQVQEALAKKGYYEVGQPDGLDGPRTQGAIKMFQSDHGMPVTGKADDQLLAAIVSSAPRQIAQARAETTATNLRESGNTQVKTLDGVGWLGKALGLGGILGGIEKSGMLDKATETLTSAQETLGTVTTVLTSVIGFAQWCFSHWWLFAIGGALYLLFKVTTGILNMVVLFRQGILARSDK